MTHATCRRLLGAAPDAQLDAERSPRAPPLCLVARVPQLRAQLLLVGPVKTKSRQRVMQGLRLAVRRVLCGTGKALGPQYWGPTAHRPALLPAPCGCAGQPARRTSQPPSARHAPSPPRPRAPTPSPAAPLKERSKPREGESERPPTLWTNIEPKPPARRPMHPPWRVGALPKTAFSIWTRSVNVTALPSPTHACGSLSSSLEAENALPSLKIPHTRMKAFASS
jgi:hypothetical protein